MTLEEQREQLIQNITGLLRNNRFTFEFKVKKRPEGIKIIYEMTQEELDAIMKKASEKQEKGL